MQTSGQFGVPPEVPSHYNPVSNTMNNNNSNSTNRTTSTTGSNQALGHMLFNFSTPLDQHAPLSSPPPPPPPHSSLSQPAPVPPVLLLGKAGTRDGAADLFQESNPSHQQPQQQQQQQNSRFSNFLQSSAAAPDHFQATDSAQQEKTVAQQKKGNMESGQAQAAQQAAGDQVQSMQLQHQLSLGIDQGYSEGGGTGKGNAENQQMSADPISLGDIDQAEEGAGAGGRWPRQETLALLKIRADMDALFRDTSVKRPLWDEVSRKMGELGYERSAKKCKEKFENVNKYYKRTKDGKVGRQDGKHYRFFTQLEALSSNNNNTTTNNHSTAPLNPLTSLSPATMLISNSISSTIDTITKFKASASHDSPSLIPGASAVDPNPCTSEPLPFLISAPPPPPLHLIDRPPLFPTNASAATLQLSSPSSADDDDDDDDDGDDDDDDDADDDNADSDHPRPRSADPPHDPSHPESKKRKRKASTSMMAFFESLLKKVIDKQEQMQQKFLQALERRETDRMIREEAWRRQEMARLSKEHELRAQERSSAAARDAALISFLQKFTGQTIDLPTVSASRPIAAQPVQSAPPLHQESMTLQQYEDQDPSDPNSRRWLKPEVLALIDLHSSLQAKFTEAGPKGHLWEEVANGMAKLGYSSRTAKRCKEKWENINKYFKRAKESNKKRPENAKTCPYFHELDALYRKGSLGSSNVNQLPYKPSIEHPQPQIDGDSVLHLPSSTSINTGQGTDGMDIDCARNLQAQPPTISGAPLDQAVALDATASITSTVSVMGSGDVNNRVVGDVCMRNVNNNGGLQSKGSSMQLSVDALHGAPAGMNASSTSDHNVNSGARGGFTAELGLNSEQQSAGKDGHQHKQMNQSEFGKVNAGGEKESQVQSGLKESKPSILAPLPNSASFMSTMLQKINSSGTAVNNITTNRDQ